MFRVDLVAALGYSDGAQGGRPPFDPVMMFKILVIQAMDNLSDERAEPEIVQRSSKRRGRGVDRSVRLLTTAGINDPVAAGLVGTH